MLQNVSTVSRTRPDMKGSQTLHFGATDQCSHAQHSSSSAGATPDSKVLPVPVVSPSLKAEGVAAANAVGAVEGIERCIGDLQGADGPICPLNALEQDVQGHLIHIGLQSRGRLSEVLGEVLCAVSALSSMGVCHARLRNGAAHEPTLAPVDLRTPDLWGNSTYRRPLSAAHAHAATPARHPALPGCWRGQDAAVLPHAPAAPVGWCAPSHPPAAAGGGEVPQPAAHSVHETGHTVTAWSVMNLLPCSSAY